MKKAKENLRERRIISAGIILNLVLATFAFAFLISLIYVGEVRGDDPNAPTQWLNKYTGQWQVSSYKDAVNDPAYTGMSARVIGPGVTSGAKAAKSPLIIGKQLAVGQATTSPATYYQTNSKITINGVDAEGNAITNTIEPGYYKLEGNQLVSYDGQYKYPVNDRAAAQKLLSGSGKEFDPSNFWQDSWGKTVNVNGKPIGLTDALTNTNMDSATREALANQGYNNVQYDSSTGAGTFENKDHQLVNFNTDVGGKIENTYNYEGFWAGYGHGIVGSLAQGLEWSLYVAGAIQLVGNLMGLAQDQTNAMTLAAVGGIMSYQLVKGTFEQGTFGATEFFNKPGGNFLGGQITNGQFFGAIAGVAVAWIILELMWKDTKTKSVTITCEPWEAPVGGKDCELCNKDPYRPCTEYRCKSLGQACELVNAGTGNESCVWVNPHDVDSPIITTWTDALPQGYNYNPSVVVRPAKRGAEIYRTTGDDRCVKAFTPLSFGITTNEPSQCKIDYNHTLKMDNMAFDFGGTNLYMYNHTETLSLPGPDALQSVSPQINNDGTFTMFVRCRDKNGNENVDEFSFRFCVEKGPDTTPPDMITTSFGTGAPFTFNTTTMPVDLYTNEPADCKWSHEDKSYDSMESNMSCANNLWDMTSDLNYKCSGTLNGLKNRADNKFYFRCRDQPQLEGTDKQENRNTNQQSFVLTLKGTQPLDITSISPFNETVKGYGDVIEVDLKADVKNGYNDNAFCYFSPTANEKDYVLFANTNSMESTQRFDLTSGTYTYYVKCVDLGGNTQYNVTTFTVESDTQAPQIVRVYKEGEQLKIVTDEESVCTYSTNTCNFAITEGIDMPTANSKEHIATWNVNTNYYIKCKDQYDNQPGPSECNSVVRGFEVS